MKTLIIVSAFLFILSFGQAQTSYQFHLVYLDGNLLEVNTKKNLVVGDSLLADAKVKLEGKLAIFLDTLGNIMRTLNIETNQSKELLIKDLEGIKGSAPRCCASSYTYFKINKEKPFPIFNSSINLSLTSTEIDNFTNSDYHMGFSYLINGKEDFRRFPLNEAKNSILFYKIIEYIQKFSQDSLMKSFGVYRYERVDNVIKDKHFLFERNIILINPSKLKKQLESSIQFFKTRFPRLDKDNKELIISCLSLLIYELYGYPDEENLLIWLKDNFQYNLR